ncbi:MAG: hypothetical protein WDK96_01505 [Candidatus Paceibacterota bacterium]|jgi:hypothetical protein
MKNNIKESKKNLIKMVKGVQMDQTIDAVQGLVKAYGFKIAASLIRMTLEATYEVDQKNVKEEKSKNRKEMITVEFKDGKKNICIASERRPGETKNQHEERIELMKKMMIDASISNKYGGLCI